MGVEYLESLHERLKGKVSGAVFVIVPITHCDPGLFADVFPLGRMLFFVLRVPYSAIEAIHGRPFKVLDQPFSQADLNDPVDTFGFDFMQVPEVKLATSSMTISSTSSSTHSSVAVSIQTISMA